jgi:uncharacterized membrane protein YedE/YeeE
MRTGHLPAIGGRGGDLWQSWGVAVKRVSHQRAVPRAPTVRRRRPKTKRGHGFRRDPREKGRSWREFLDHARTDPKAALEGDLKAMLAGLVIAILGSFLVGGDAYWTVWSSSPGPPVPILGVIVFFIGGAIILAGIVLAFLCIVVNLLARVTKQRES